MDKKLMFLIACLLFKNSAFSLSYSASDLSRSIEIDNYKITFKERDEISEAIIIKEEYLIEWENLNGISYISFNYTGKALRNETNGYKKYLILYDETENFMFLSLYNSNNKLVYEIFGWRYTVNAGRRGIIEATSELKEGNIIYSANNLVNPDILMPWVEGVNGPGIGQKLKLKLGGNYNPDWMGILLSNGYVDYNRPYLYTNNNRIKTIRIWYGDTGDYTDYDIKDTAHYQYLAFSSKYGGYNSSINIQYITLEIVDIYSGDRWDDTCINLIYAVAD
jgi:hypothetical protein